MEALFLKLVNMSITASWLVLAIIAVRLVFRKTPKWILCLLWGLVAVRLICPFSIESALSLIPSAEPFPQEIIYTAKPQLQSGIIVVDNTINPMLESSMTPIESASANPTQLWSFILSQIWILGMVLMFVYAAISFLLIKRKVATAIPLRQNIKRCEFIDSPFVLGLLIPVIYLPATLEKKDWDYVIAHEEAHIQRRDHWWKPMGFLLLSIYWFNPVMWIAYILLCRDIEAACDEKVIRNMKTEDFRGYSMALLKCSIHQRSITACPLAFGEVGIKKRIQHVMNYRKPSFWVILVSLALILLLSVTLLTNPERRYDPDKVYPQSVLQDPDSIYIDVSGTDRVFEKDTEVYKRLVEALRANWWKYTEENADTAPDTALVAPIAPEVLKTTSWRTYVENSDTIICFRYTENPVIWENAEGEQKEIQTICFVLPEKTWSEENTRGFFLISKTEQIGYNEGLYTYYYPAEIANDFWDFVNNAKLNEVTVVPGKTMTLNDVIMLSQKGTDLVLDDLAGYAYSVQGDSLLALRTYPINDEWHLLVHHGGGLEKPISVWLTHSASRDLIDITQGNEKGAITDFIGSHNPVGKDAITDMELVQYGSLKLLLGPGFLYREQGGEIVLMKDSMDVGGVICWNHPGFEPVDLYEWVKALGFPEFQDNYNFPIGYIAGNSIRGGFEIEIFRDGNPDVLNEEHEFFIDGDLVYDVWYDQNLISDDIAEQFLKTVTINADHIIEVTQEEREALETCKAVVDVIQNGSYHIAWHKSRTGPGSDSGYAGAYYSHNKDWMHITYLNVGNGDVETQYRMKVNGKILYNVESPVKQNISWSDGDVSEPELPWLTYYKWDDSKVVFKDMHQIPDQKTITFQINEPFYGFPEESESYLATFFFDGNGNFLQVELQSEAIRSSGLWTTSETESIISLDPVSVNAKIQKEYQRIAG